MADSESEVRRFRTRQPKTPDIREANPCGVCAIGRKAATDHEESMAMDTNKGGNKGSSALTPEIMAVGPEHPREPQAVGRLYPQIHTGAENGRTFLHQGRDHRSRARAPT